MSWGKNLWHRKSVRREILRNVELRVEGGAVFFVTRPLRPYVTCKGRQKLILLFFITNYMLNIFLFTIFFKQYFPWKSCKIVLGAYLAIFLGKRGVLLQKLTYNLLYYKLSTGYFIIKQVFRKEPSIFLKNGEKPFVGGHYRFEGKGASGNKNQCNLFGRIWHI